ncbi:uncharacterized protein LOC110987709 [Acanthaster planci]|uniref:Uncharacterized protein LOC110987709 n=1 Tax=Acanthaster planci TaxID=133434 RepID=A0A8B7ZLA0_ACAPL|nr:uncharacterized protein LOC110987709 [Acanthaster planci]
MQSPPPTLPTFSTMNNVQLEHALLADKFTRPYFQGIYPANGLPKEPVPWPSAFVVTAKSIPSFFINHWIGIYITPDGEGEVFDSLGHPPRHPMLQDFLRRNTTRIVYNRVQIQGSQSSVCGQHVLYFLLQRCRGFHPEYIVRSFCPDHDLNDAFVEDFAQPLLLPPSNSLFL